MMLRAPILLLALSLCACTYDASRPANDKAAVAASDDPCHLTMGWDSWEPYHYRDVGGEVRGLDIELVSAIAAIAGCTVSFDQEDWATLLRHVRSGEIDVVSGATRTPAREQFAWFSDTYREERFGLYVRTGDSAKFTAPSLEQLIADGMTVGITIEYFYGNEFEALQRNPAFAKNIMGAAVGELNFDRLLNFKIDGLLEDPFVAAAVIRKKGLERNVEAHQLVLSTGPVQLMFSKASVDQELFQRLNAALAEIRASGDYQHILDRYRL